MERRPPRPRVALATSAAHASLTADDRRLVPELDRQGVHSEAAIWDDPHVAWQRFAAVVVRSTWDYHHRPAAFVAWIARLEALGVPVLNPPAVVRWNLDKTYLRELEERGVPIVPTAWVEAGGTPSLRAILAERGWSQAVVKPSVSATAHGAWRTTADDAERDERRFAASCAASRVLVQPFVESITRRGEWSLIFLAGAFSHAVRKRPARGDYRVQSDFGGSVTIESGRAAPVAAARAVVRALPFPATGWLYARVDGVEDGGVFRLMELELIEPALFLAARRDAAARLAAAIARRIPGFAPPARGPLASRGR